MKKDTRTKQQGPHAFWPGLILVLALACLVLVCACSSKKADRKSPELPPRYWLEEAPGVPAEHGPKLKSVVNDLMDKDKVYGFDDCVFLAIIQSPLLVKSGVDIEINRLAFTDTVWRYVPEPRLRFNVSNNLTRYNEGERDKPNKYGQLAYRYDYYAAVNSPIVTYFEQKVQKALTNVAVSIHRKAIGEIIKKIAEAHLSLRLYRQIIAKHKKLLEHSKQLIAYWRQVENVDGEQGSALELAIQHQKELALTLEKYEKLEAMQHTALMVLMGADTKAPLKVDVSKPIPVLEKFNGNRERWEKRWVATEDELLLRAQILLKDYNIYVAWAKFLPTLSTELNNNPPSGQKVPRNGMTDYFLHLTFDVPLIDWGSRYRGVQISRMEKAGAIHGMAHKKAEYSHDWLKAMQEANLAATELKLAKTRLETARMQLAEVEIAYKEGTEEMPLLFTRQEQATEALIRVDEAELQYKKASLEWMYVASLLQEHYLGLPAKDIETERRD